MVHGKAFLGMASVSSAMVSASSIVAAHADWEDYPRYVKRHGLSLVNRDAGSDEFGGVS